MAGNEKASAATKQATAIRVQNRKKKKRKIDKQRKLAINEPLQHHITSQF